MTIEYVKRHKGDEKYVRRESGITKYEFENLVHKNIPGWTAVWNMLLQENKETRKKQGGTEITVDLQKKIRRKISELLDEEETLVNLYKKAAEVAKRKEEEFNDKTAILIRQIEKDKNFMKELKNDYKSFVRLN